MQAGQILLKADGFIWGRSHLDGYNYGLGKNVYFDQWTIDFYTQPQGCHIFAEDIFRILKRGTYSGI